MHILIIPSAYPSKEEPLRSIFFKEQAKALKEAGNKVGVIYSETRRVSNISYKRLRDNHFQTSYSSEEGVNTIRLHGWNILMMRNFLGVNLWVKQTINLYNKYIKTYGKPDVIHVHCGLYGGLVAKFIKDKYSIPYVLTEHSSLILNNYLNEYNKKILQNVYNNSDMLISVGSKLKKAMNNYTNKDIVVIPNIVDTENFKVLESKNDSKFKFITVANLKHSKRVDLVIDAFKKLKENNKNIELYIAGDGPEKSNLKLKIDKYNLQDDIHLLGKVSRESLPELMGKAQVFVLPSIYETFGVVYIEALACGIPIIATKCGGPEDFFEDNLGYMININNLDELFYTMEKSIIEYSKFNKEEISRYIKSRFSKEVIVKELENIYNRLVRI